MGINNCLRVGAWANWEGERLGSASRRRTKCRRGKLWKIFWTLFTARKIMRRQGRRNRWSRHSEGKSAGMAIDCNYLYWSSSNPPSNLQLTAVSSSYHSDPVRFISLLTTSPLILRNSHHDEINLIAALWSLFSWQPIETLLRSCQILRFWQTFIKTVYYNYAKTLGPSYQRGKSK